MSIGIKSDIITAGGTLVNNNSVVGGPVSEKSIITGNAIPNNNIISGGGVKKSRIGVVGSISTGQVWSNVRINTTAGWNAQLNLIAEKNVVYMYTDHLYNEDGEPVPAFKVGDGLAYLIDLPFNDDVMIAHINNKTVHVTDEEREFWNNKVTAYLNAEDLEELILTKN